MLGFFGFYEMRKKQKKNMCLVLVIRFSGFRVTLYPFSFQFVIKVTEKSQKKIDF